MTRTGILSATSLQGDACPRAYLGLQRVQMDGGWTRSSAQQEGNAIQGRGQRDDGAIVWRATKMTIVRGDTEDASVRGNAMTEAMMGEMRRRSDHSESGNGSNAAATVRWIVRGQREGAIVRRAMTTTIARGETEDASVRGNAMMEGMTRGCDRAIVQRAKRARCGCDRVWHIWTVSAVNILTSVYIKVRVLY
jgi:hypothetical protein